MTAEVVALPGWQMCRCGSAVASFPIPGGLVCETCFDATEKVPAADFIFIAEPDEPKLDDILAALTKAAP